MDTQSTLILCAVFVIVAAFLQGYSDRLDQIDKASMADRQRVYCSTPHHLDSICPPLYKE
jgi:hypothetical protein